MPLELGFDSLEPVECEQMAAPPRLYKADAEPVCAEAWAPPGCHSAEPVVFDRGLPLELGFDSLEPVECEGIPRFIFSGAGCIRLRRAS